MRPCQLLEAHTTTQFAPGASGAVTAIPTERTRAEIAAWARHAAAANGFGDAATVEPQPVADAHERVASPARKTFWQRVRRVLAAAFDSWMAERQRRADLAVLAHLDGATLRDLGIDRSEIRSIVLESAGAAQMTRRRIVQRSAGAFHDGWLPIQRTDRFF